MLRHHGALLGINGADIVVGSVGIAKVEPIVGPPVDAADDVAEGALGSDAHGAGAADDHIILAVGEGHIGQFGAVGRNSQVTRAIPAEVRLLVETIQRDHIVRARQEPAGRACDDRACGLVGNLNQVEAAFLGAEHVEKDLLGATGRKHQCCCHTGNERACFFHTDRVFKIVVK